MSNERIDFVLNSDGPEIGYCLDSGPWIIKRDGLCFKKHTIQPGLLPYEDWRLPAEDRAGDLAARMDIKEIAGLMLYSNHQMVPALPGDFIESTYKGKTFKESGCAMGDLTDQQKEFLENDNIRHVLAMRLHDPVSAAEWNNNMQAFAEKLGWGIPVNISSDPRHGAANSDKEYKGGGGSVSKWPEGIAMAATFSPEICREFAGIASIEYRALGITTALSPQVDLATEPRWMRFCDTFGEHPGLSADMGRAYCDGMQTSENINTGWGNRSVAVMAKHWPGGGSGEGGRDAHYAYGKYNVYPGKNFEGHLYPFINGVLRLNGPTCQCASIMPYYSVSWGYGGNNGNVGNSYNGFLIKDLLRDMHGYKGVICTDWDITRDHSPKISDFGSRCWGVEELSQAERILVLLENGVDQLGGNNEAGPLLDAYELGCEKYGEQIMRKRMEESAVRLLTNMFRCGLFENPYLRPELSGEIVGSRKFVEAGYQAQLKSVVMLKNHDSVLPLDKKLKVYIPMRHIKAHRGFFGPMVPPADIIPVPDEILKEYFIAVDRPEEADAGIVFISSPLTDGYSDDDLEKGGNGYLPISLQYRPYTAAGAREQSIAGGDPSEDFTNRSYKGKTSYAANESDLDNVIETSKRLSGKPLIVVARLSNPTVMEEVEPYADAIIAEFGIQVKAALDILTGVSQPSGLLPFQMPRDMQEVECQCEDTPFDMQPYTDGDGNTYDFGFGLNWEGRINDWRNEIYKK